MVAAEKREPRKFEPPPWERERFEKLERQDSDHGRTTEPDEGPADESAGAEDDEISALLSAQTRARAEATGSGGPSDEPATDQDLERTMSEMLAGLSAQEREQGSTVDTRRIGYGVALLLAFFGTALGIWSIVAYVRTSNAGILAVSGSCIVGFMSLMMLVAAGWAVTRANKSRGA
jgi:hypothetical protein